MHKASGSSIEVSEESSAKLDTGSEDLATEKTKEGSSDTSLVAESSLSHIPKGPTTTPSESHSDTINPQESCSDDNSLNLKPMCAGGKTSMVSGDSEKSKDTSYKTEPATSEAPVSSISDKSEKTSTSEPRPVDGKTSVSEHSDETDSGAVAVATEENPGDLGNNEGKKLTQEQLDNLFVKETQENLLGLIGALLPKDSKVGR